MVVENRPGGGTVIGTEPPRAPRRTAAQSAGGEFLRHQSGAEEAELRPVDQVRADLLFRRDADGARRQRRVALSARSPISSTPRAPSPESGVLERRPGVLPAHRHRGAQARGEHRHHLRALCRNRARDQRAAGRPCDRGLCGLSDGGVAVAVGRARAGHHVAGAGRGAARVPTFAETGMAKYEAESSTVRGAGENAARDDLAIDGLGHAALKAPETKPKLAKRGSFRSEIAAPNSAPTCESWATNRPHHSRIEYQGRITETPVSCAD